MTKIDETKRYKFSEIVRMVEDKELPEGTLLKNSYYHFEYEVIKTDKGFSIFEPKGVGNAPTLCSRLLNFKWTIKLPKDKEDKYYLKAPKEFGDKYLNLNMRRDVYFISDAGCGNDYQKTQFTQSEISAMPFKTNFFKKIKVED
ncbi:hypothetical protein MX629_13925 [Carnobacterium divergens]|uniref:Uncharacterized protein n=1 Tax=Carnobacterium divergens TaxID=2748 RepID=A0AAW8RCT8_CARDV|nr:hypothetical protein [Carnobacterium divergens]MDT1959518.1 hypothetical protein [Carnobacterium divergens]MDT1975485.1 hypothetical protein [Carnobacterium divergens]